LSKLTQDDVRVNGENITVTLPPSEIFSSALNNDETRVYDRKHGLLARGDTKLETKARQAAEASILQAACDQGILQQAAEEAQVQMSKMLNLLDFKQVTVNAPAGSCPAPPAANS